MQIYGIEQCDVCFDLIDIVSRKQHQFVHSYNVNCLLCETCYEKILDMTEEQLDYFFPPHIKRQVVYKYEGVPFMKWVGRSSSSKGYWY
ncbi:hypothetical protein AAGS61_04835 [Lysinibacillus sp. KU-BSD001]|uniref:hypothetical protein n=1 Tax=Lysinibacillus sp. KU-BSD001 TaxID=3141328 RepID=UPI0036E048D8